MIRALFVLLCCALLGQFLVDLTGVPLPGPVVGMMLMLVLLVVARPSRDSSVVRGSETLLEYLQLFFVPAGVGVVAYASVLQESWLPLVGGLLVSWFAALAAAGGVGAATLRAGRRWRRRREEGR